MSGHRKYPFGSLNEQTRRRSMEIMRKAVDLADFLGIRIIQLAGYDVYYEEGNERTEALFLENLHKATEYAARAGVMLGFETMETEFMDTVQKTSYKSTFLGAVFFRPLSNKGRICSNCSFVMSPGYCFLILLL